jgi:hypothetical protein
MPRRRAKGLQLVVVYQLVVVLLLSDGTKAGEKLVSYVQDHDVARTECA